MKKKRVICAMSGGVDSSVAAALLKKQGYEVIGIFMKLWSDEASETDMVRENICCSIEAATAARAVAQTLKIPFYVVNFADAFKKTVVDYYIKEYDAGRTPNPCVICNRDIKGEVLMQKVLELDADFLATGHYVRINQKSKVPSAIASEALRADKNKNDKSKIKKEKKEYQLLKSKDKNKDQSYFLWTLTQEKLSKLLFPIGEYTKPEVRKMASKLGLPTAERRESQGICFIPDRDVCGFLRRHAKKLTKSGPIIDVNGKKIGLHDGLINYTIGQRQRLGLGGPKAYYVLSLDSKKNRLIVGDETDLYQKSLIATNLNWQSSKANINDRKLHLTATIRYGHPDEECAIEDLAPDKIKVIFAKPQRAITPGQSIVFYHDKEMLGGGIIKESLL